MAAKECTPGPSTDVQKTDSKSDEFIGECLYNGPYNISTNLESYETPEKMVDFEELIDLMRNQSKTSLLIQDFDNVMTNFEMYEINKDGSLNLDEVDDFLTSQLHSVDDEKSYIPLLVVTNNKNGGTPVLDINNYDNKDNNNKNVDFTILEEKIAVQNIEQISSLTEDTSHKEIKLDTVPISLEATHSTDDGYNSSDFEFITEEEAKMDGYIINININDTKTTKIKMENTLKPRNTGKNKLKYVNFGENLNSSEINVNDISNNFGEGTSRLNNTEEVENSLIRSENTHSRESHIIPEGEAFLDLFRGPYNPVLPMSDIIILENKSVRPSAMNMQYEGIGFDDQFMRRMDSSEEEYEDEAKQSVKKILSMYPRENRRKRRRF